MSHKRASIAGISAPEDLDEDAEDEGQTNSEAVFNLLNNCLGSGVLTVSFAFTHVGLAGGCTGLVASAILNLHPRLHRPHVLVALPGGLVEEGARDVVGAPPLDALAVVQVRVGRELLVAAALGADRHARRRGGRQWRRRLRAAPARRAPVGRDDGALARVAR